MEQKLIDAMTAVTNPTTTPPPPSGNLPDKKWNGKWLNLETRHHPMLRKLETEVGRFCFDMWREPLRGRLMVLSGKNGNGKTHCAKAVRRWVDTVGRGRAVELAPLSLIFWHWPALLDTLKNGGWDLVEDCFTTPLLVIDELGGGHDPSGVGVDKLCQILTRRENKWTLITTNIAPQAWRTEFDNRVASRFFRNSTLIDLSDVPDYNAS